MLLLFSIRLAEWPLVWEKAVHSVYLACFFFFFFFVNCNTFPLGFEGGMWDLIVMIPDHCLSIYMYFTIVEIRECWQAAIK